MTNEELAVQVLKEAADLQDAEDNAEVQQRIDAYNTLPWYKKIGKEPPE